MKVGLGPPVATGPACRRALLEKCQHEGVGGSARGRISNRLAIQILNAVNGRICPDIPEIGSTSCLGRDDAQWRSLLVGTECRKSACEANVDARGDDRLLTFASALGP